MSSNFPIVFSIPESTITDMRNRLGGHKAALALQQALSLTIQQGRKAIARRLVEEVNLRIGTITDRKYMAVSKGSWRSLKGWIKLTRRPVPMWEYLGRQRGTHLKNLASGAWAKLRRPGGLEIAIRKKQSPEQFPKAFIAQMPTSSYVGAFERVGVKDVMKLGRYEGQRREKIRRLYGPTAVGVMAFAKGEEGQPTILAETAAKMARRFLVNIKSKLDWMLSAAGRATARRKAARLTKALGHG
jgi:hypothetical protein